MKKISLMFLCGILTAYVAHAQLEIGVKGGLNFPTASVAAGASDIVSDPSYEFAKTSGSGWHAGAFVKIKVAMLAINPEVIYTSQTSVFEIENIGEMTQQINYLTVPVILRFYLPFGLNFQAGPQFGFPVSGEETYDISSIPTTPQDLLTDLKGTDIGLNLGVGFDLPFGLDVHARYVMGLNDVNDVASATEEFKNSQILVSLAYSLKK